MIARDELLRAEIQMECTFPHHYLACGIVEWSVGDLRGLGEADVKIALLCEHYARLITLVEKNHRQAVYDHVGRLAAHLFNGESIESDAGYATLDLQLNALFGLVKTKLQIDPWLHAAPADSTHTYEARLSLLRGSSSVFWYEFKMGTHQNRIYVPASLFVLLRAVVGSLPPGDQLRCGKALLAMNDFYRQRNRPLGQLAGQTDAARSGYAAIGISPQGANPTH